MALAVLAVSVVFPLIVSVLVGCPFDPVNVVALSHREVISDATSDALDLISDAAADASDRASDATDVPQDSAFEATSPPADVKEEYAAAPPVATSEAMEVASLAMLVARDSPPDTAVWAIPMASLTTSGAGVVREGVARRAVVRRREVRAYFILVVVWWFCIGWVVVV